MRGYALLTGGTGEMLVSKPADFTTEIVEPVDIRLKLMPIRLALTHGIIDHDNFKKALNNYQYDIERVIDIPSNSNIFIGKWLDFTGSGVDELYNIRYKENEYFDSLLFSTIGVSDTDQEGMLWYRFINISGTTYLDYGIYDGTTFTPTGRATAAVGSANIAGVGAYTLAGTVKIKSVPSLGVGQSTTPDYYFIIDTNNWGSGYNGYAYMVYSKFSDMAHYANQKHHFIRSMDFQISMSREMMQNLTQGLVSGIESAKTRQANAATEINRYISDEQRLSRLTPGIEQIARGLEAQRGHNTDKLNATLATYNEQDQIISSLKDVRVSITNRFRMEKPYASDFVNFNAVGSNKMKFLDDAGSEAPNKMHYQAYVSAETDDELEITIHSFFENNEVFGEKDYSFCLGRLEILFEARI